MDRCSGIAMGFGVLALLLAPAAARADDEAELLAADGAFATTPPDVDRFVEFFTLDGRFYPPGAPLAEGRQAIRDVVVELFSAPGFSLRWKATHAEASVDGSLGFTGGTFELGGERDGRPTRAVGKYVTVWRKRADGRWSVVADIFNTDR